MAHRVAGEAEVDLVDVFAATLAKGPGQCQIKQLDEEWLLPFSYQFSCCFSPPARQGQT
jgi:hypothetical protein